MVFKDGRFLLQDQTTQEVIELSGPNLAANVGNRVEARGAPSSTAGVAPATSAMSVASLALVAQGGCLSVAATLDAKTEVPPPAVSPTKAAGPGAASTSSKGPAARTGMSAGAKIAIVAAVAGGGAGAALALGGGKKSTSP
jgi:hypothetical protein